MKGGVSLNEPTRFGNDASRRYVVGVSTELGAWNGLSLEVDFLYRRNAVHQGFFYLGLPETFNSTGSSSAAHAVEIPVLAKYTFRRDSRVQPFVLTGYSFRKAWVESTIQGAYEGPDGQPVLVESRLSDWSPVDVGATFGAGVAFRTGRVTISPEFRYVRWGGSPVPVLSRNQADFLLGITF